MSFYKMLYSYPGIDNLHNVPTRHYALQLISGNDRHTALLNFFRKTMPMDRIIEYVEEIRDQDFVNVYGNSLARIL